MKKVINILTSIICIFLIAFSLLACSTNNEDQNSISQKNVTTPDSERIYWKSPDDIEHAHFERLLIENRNISEDFHRNIARKMQIFGVKRIFEQNHLGTYTVDYVRYPKQSDIDETLNYVLTLNENDLFDFMVTVNGITSTHYGHYYIHRGGSIVLFYDEKIEDSAHNVFICDSLYAELLPNGKIMFYDDCKTIVLSKEEKTPQQDTTKESLNQNNNCVDNLSINSY